MSKRRLPLSNYVANVGALAGMLITASAVFLVDHADAHVRIGGYVVVGVGATIAVGVPAVTMIVVRFKR